MKSNYLKVIIKYKDIKRKIIQCAKKLVKDLNSDSDIIFINLLNGSSPFFVDVIREINNLGYNKYINIEYISISSYENIKSMNLKINKWLDVNIKNKILYLFEDVIDSGKTLTKVIDKLMLQMPKKINIISLTDKKELHLNFPYEYYALFEVKNYFLVGYGLDCDEKFRQLRDICIYKN